MQQPTNPLRPRQATARHRLAALESPRSSCESLCASLGVHGSRGHVMAGFILGN